MARFIELNRPFVHVRNYSCVGKLLETRSSSQRERERERDPLLSRATRFTAAQD